MVALRTVISLAALILGVSGLALDLMGMHNAERGLLQTAHRRHVLDLRSPEPTETIAQRRSLRKKRCAQRQPSSSVVSASTSPAQDTNPTPTNVPQNVAPAPTPTSSSTFTPQPAPSPDNGDNGHGNTSASSSPPSGGGNTYTGDLTFYDVGTGACGVTNTDSDMICAASMLLYDGFDGYTGANPNNNPICGKQVAITYGGKTITVTIEDRCVGCAEYDLDLSPAAFNQLADPSVGRLHGATWQFV
jgi:hypothetical protein